MKKLLFTLFLMIGAICGNAQTAKIYKDGTMVQTIDNIDSVRFSQETTTIDIPSYAFSVAADKKVVFSPGNLQYTQSTNTWAFAEHQYDTIGAANISGGALADKIDLFGWSASNTTAPFGINISSSNANYAGDFVDWGMNAISTYAPNTWRTLTIDEWKYLFMHTRWTMAKVNGTLGFMLLPTDFTAPSGMTVTILGDGNMSTYKKFNESDYASNVYTADQFAQLESLGCIFLPGAGYRDGSYMRSVGSYGQYWSATPRDDTGARMFVFKSVSVDAYEWDSRSRANSVRLVQDVRTSAAGGPAHTSAESTKEIKTQVVTVYQSGDKAHRFAEVDSVVVVETPVVTSTNKFAVAEGKYVAFSPGNLQYTQSTNTWAFAEHQYDTIGAANIGVDALADKIDLFGWGTGNNPTQSSTDNSDYPTFVDWGTNRIGDDAPNTWRTLTKDEWTYLFQHTRWTMARVNGTLGFMLLPADFTAPTGMTVAILADGNISGGSKSFYHSDYTSNQYTAAEFAQLESLGVVFLPCAGDRYGLNMKFVGSYGYYWSATTHGEYEAKGLNFYATCAYMYNHWYRFYGNSVRLVKDL